ncbi:DUF7144 family membrane protein [Actinomycetospora cinnamomea]|uniref:DUF7144 domain-containing protein n=1 Tax=Actinomycetospora cinnamomea TaxID=663609 RepID=A0A2U1EDB0_9PSEU|nr:hypothetical protein [Actinomycetospora cinnamomea]PVY97953.1 hypothetical protein C8D89_1228 [Actinomycetospora cinnamomea]
MSGTQRTPAQWVDAIYTPGPRSYGSDVDDWTRWIRFAGIVMMIAGAIGVIQGLVALLQPSFYVVNGGDRVLAVVSAGVWGWVHLVLGVLVAAAGVGVLAGRLWARVVGIALAATSAVVNLLFLAVYPMWAVVVIALDIAVIFALATDRRGARM